jgi:hypothetical protein
MTSGQFQTFLDSHGADLGSIVFEPKLLTGAHP